MSGRNSARWSWASNSLERDRLTSPSHLSAAMAALVMSIAMNELWAMMSSMSKDAEVQPIVSERVTMKDD